MIAQALSIRISISAGIPIATPLNVGRKAGMDPKSTIIAVATRKRITDVTAVFTLRISLNLSEFSLIMPCSIRRRYSGSSISSFPTRFDRNAPTSTPTSVAGIVTFNMSNRVMSVSNPSNATVAAEIGLAVMACCDAITAIPRGRSGRTLVSRATSAMTGSTEYATWPVPATNVKK